MFLLAFSSTQNIIKNRIKWKSLRYAGDFFTLGIKKISVLTLCPLYSVRFTEVFLWEFIRKTAGT